MAVFFGRRSLKKLPLLGVQRLAELVECELEARHETPHEVGDLWPLAEYVQLRLYRFFRAAELVVPRRLLLEALDVRCDHVGGLLRAARPRQHARGPGRGFRSWAKEAAARPAPVRNAPGAAAKYGSADIDSEDIPF